MLVDPTRFALPWRMQMNGSTLLSLRINAVRAPQAAGGAA
jgi:hypothetical protein